MGVFIKVPDCYIELLKFSFTISYILHSLLDELKENLLFFFFFKNFLRLDKYYYVAKLVR